jgi:hypothetical protein
MIGVAVLLYIATIGYFLKYKAIILRYSGVPVPIWIIPEQVKHFTMLMQITAIFTALSLSFEVIYTILLGGGVEDGGKAERKS